MGINNSCSKKDSGPPQQNLKTALKMIKQNQKQLTIYKNKA